MMSLRLFDKICTPVGQLPLLGVKCLSRLNIAFLASPNDGCRVAYFCCNRLALARWQLSCLNVVALLRVTDQWEGPSPGIPEDTGQPGYHEHTLGIVSIPRLGGAE